jgi:hypothetical protein
VATSNNSSNSLTPNLGDSFNSASSTFANIGSTLNTDNPFGSLNTSLNGSSYPNQDSVLKTISDTFETTANELPLTSSGSESNPFTSGENNGAQSFGLRIRTAIDKLVGFGGVPAGNTGSESTGSGTPVGASESSSNSRPQLGPFDRLLDIEGVNGVEDIFGNLGGGSGSGGNGGSFGGGAGTGSPFTNFGNPNADGSPLFGGTNPWSAINTAQAGAGNGSPLAGGNSFGNGGGNPFTSGVSTPVAADVGTTAPADSGSSTGGQWTWDFSALESSGGGNPFAGGGSGGGNPFAGGGSGGGNPFAGGGGNPFA